MRKNHIRSIKDPMAKNPPGRVQGEVNSCHTVNLLEPNERHKRGSRRGCYARLQIKIIDGGIYRVYSFEEAQNHCLALDFGKQFLNHNRQLSTVHQNIIMHCGKYRVGANKTYHLVKDLFEGFANFGATVTEFKKFKRDLKLYIGLNNAKMVVDGLTNKKNTFEGFF
ncbi:hypothetical protein QQ045_003409 [Rhodiola kirilowii]